MCERAATLWVVCVQDVRIQAAKVQDVGVHEVQDDAAVQGDKGDMLQDDVGVEDEKDDTSQQDAHADCEELLSQKSTESECELLRSTFYLTGNGSADCSEEL